VPNRIQILAQAATPDPAFQPVQPGQAVESGVDYVQELVQNLVRYSNLLAALLTLLVGLLIAAIARAVVRESSIALT